MRETEQVLITVRTYPNPSTQYEETVCTGGVTRDGHWRRLYPVPLRNLDEDKQFQKWTIIDVDVQPVSSDGRPESRKPELTSIKIVRTLRDAGAKWDWISETVLPSMKQLRAERATLRAVRARAMDIEVEDDQEDWSDKQKQIMSQGNLFKTSKPLDKIPHKFWLRWEDGAGEQHRSRIIDWEFGQTWRRYNCEYPGEALPRLRDVFMQRFEASDRLLLFMGNYAQHPQHFAVCGYFAPKKGAIRDEPSLFTGTD